MIMNLQFTIDSLLAIIVAFLSQTFLRRLLLNQSIVENAEIRKNKTPQTYEYTITVINHGLNSVLHKN